MNIVITFSTLLLVSCSILSEDKVATLADPTIYKYEGDYYLFGTETPPQVGFRIYSSDNLEDWYVPETAYEGGYVLKKETQTYGSRGFWAPQIFEYKGKTGIAYTANERIAIAFAESPLGPFLQQDVRSLNNDLLQIDPFLFFEEDGKIYLYHVRLRKGNHIYVAEMEENLSGINKETLTHCISAEKNTWEDTQTYPSVPVIEGPTLIKHKGIYYLFYSANHFMSADYAVGYATAPSPTGPWTRYEGNPIIHREHLDINGTGHGDVLIDGDDMYYVFHTHASDEEVRPRHTMLVKMRFEETESSVDKVVVDYESAVYLKKN
ncbi:MAG: glycoside hydrolase family 43 protein [Opitutales bacterium]|nr:glycoside hydrolase family 43 protein [Opitutales bacterium]